jgi:hypothetical protein
LQEYVKQLAEFGYQDMPLEQEAVRETFRLLGRPQRFKEKDNLGACSCGSSAACDTPREKNYQLQKPAAFYSLIQN